MTQPTTTPRAAKKAAKKKRPTKRELLLRCIARKAKRDGITAVQLDISDDILVVEYVSPPPNPSPEEATYEDFKPEFDRLGKRICSCLKKYHLRGVTSFEMEAYASVEAMGTLGSGEPLAADPPSGGGGGDGNTCKDPRFKPRSRKH